MPEQQEVTSAELLAAQQAYHDALDTASQVMRSRDELIRRAVAGGWGKRKIANLLSTIPDTRITEARVGQITKGNSP